MWGRNHLLLHGQAHNASACSLAVKLGYGGRKMLRPHALAEQGWDYEGSFAGLCAFGVSPWRHKGLHVYVHGEVHVQCHQGRNIS